MSYLSFLHFLSDNLRMVEQMKKYDAISHGKPLPSCEVDFVLIGAGLPRTGTMSTYTALEKILPGKCHHMARVGTDKTDRNVTFWLKAVVGDVTDEEWRQFVKDERLSAGVDYPVSLFWRDLVRIYPNAKVLLNDRDPVRWYESVRNTILQVVGVSTGPLARFNPLLQLVMFVSGRGKVLVVPKTLCYAETALGSAFPRGMFGAVEDGQEEAVKFFNAWKAQVIREVPADRLLVWQVKEGWGPLCSFLGLPVPEEPFPNVNDTPSMLQRIGIIKKLVLGTWAVTAVGLASAVYCLL